VGAPGPSGRRKILGVIYRENLEVHPQHTKCTPGENKSDFLAHFCWAGEIWRFIEYFFETVF